MLKAQRTASIDQSRSYRPILNQISLIETNRPTSAVPVILGNGENVLEFAVPGQDYARLSWQPFPALRLKPILVIFAPRLAPITTCLIKIIGFIR